MKYTLRPYQSDDVERIRAAFREGARAPLYVLPTGGGKTVVFVYITEHASTRGRRVLVLVHRRELLLQCSKHLREAGVEHGVIAPGFQMTGHQIQVASVQTVIRRFDRMHEPDLIVVDECFPAGTLVDGRRIEDIRAGDMVTAWDAVRGSLVQAAVVNVFKNKAPRRLIRVTTETGRSFTCTENHPVFSAEKGCYVPAKDLTCGQMVLTIIGGEYNESGSGQVSGMRKRSGVFGAENAGTCKEGMRVLFGFVSDYSKEKDFCGDHEPDKQEICVRENDEEQSDDESGNKSEGLNEPAGHGMEASRARGERKTRSDVSKTVGMCIGVGDGGCSSNRNEQIQRIPDMLQDRHCQHGSTNRNRSGWIEPYIQNSKIPRRKEDVVLGVERVDRVEVLEPGSSGKFGEVCPDGFVYNLEVEGLNNYFANGVLVHNCHHTVSDSYMKIVQKYPRARFLGVTATPCRLDGKGLGKEHGGLYDSLIIGPTIDALTKQNYLAPADVYAPPTELDLKGVRKNMGDFDKTEMDKRVDKPVITGCAVSHYRRLADGKPAIVFCASVKHAQHVSEEFRQAGYMSVSVDGSMSEQDRDMAVKGLSTGSVTVLTACDIISEGVDVPNVTVGILLRPTMSTSLYLQQVGRILRVCPGKEKAIILDHVGNCLRHGLPNEDREWTLEGGLQKTGCKRDPDDIRIRQCPKCYACHAVAPQCPKCGHVYEAKERKLETVSGELKKLNPDEIQKRRFFIIERQRQGRCRDLDALYALAKRKGYSEGWVQHVWRARQKKDHERASHNAARVAGDQQLGFQHVQEQCRVG